MKKQLLTLAALAALVGTVHAQQINGGLSVSGFAPGAYTSNSLTLGNNNLLSAPSGDFSGVIQTGSTMDFSTPTVTGILSTPTPENIANYFEFTSPGTIIPAGGTTPIDRFSFTLTSITEENPVLGNFIGSGILIDNADQYAPTAAEFTLGFSSDTNYSFSFATEPGAVPEPSSWALAALVCGALVALRLRRRSEVLS